jgi:DNA-binding HxlR family transcriptional regulator
LTVVRGKCEVTAACAPVQVRTWIVHSVSLYTACAPKRREIDVKHGNYECSAGCPVEATLELIGGKWKGLVLYHLLQATMRFNELRRKMPSVTQRMLTRQLRELEGVGLILRTVYAEVPPRVEYALTAEGESLRPVILALREWGRNHLAALHPDRRAA